MFFEGRDVLLAACLQVRVFVRARVVVLIVIAGIARALCSCWHSARRQSQRPQRRWRPCSPHCKWLKPRRLIACVCAYLSKPLTTSCYSVNRRGQAHIRLSLRCVVLHVHAARGRAHHDPSMRGCVGRRPSWAAYVLGSIAGSAGSLWRCAGGSICRGTGPDVTIHPSGV
jgi:hypothetical protein